MAVAIVALALAFAIVKPWGGASDVADPLGDSTKLAKASPTTRVPSTPPSSPVPRSSAEIVADQCRAPGGWRIFTIERWHDVTVHVWSAIEPVRTSDPHDPAIPYLSIVAEDVPALGYCARCSARSGRPMAPLRACGTLPRRARSPPSIPHDCSRRSRARWSPCTRRRARRDRPT